MFKKVCCCLWLMVSFAEFAGASSSAARGGKMVGLEVRVGNNLGGVRTQGVAVSYFLSSDLKLGLQYASGVYDLKDDVADVGTVSLTKADLGGTLTLAFAQFFLGNSFFVQAGLGTRQFTVDASLSDSVTSASLDMSTESNSTVASVSIGNTWSWDSGFSLGAEWIGATIPISSDSSYSVSSTVTGDSFDELVNDTKDLSEALGETVGPMLLVLNIGFAF